MQPKIIQMDKLYITGRTGDGTQTLKVWTDFDNQYNNTPFKKSNETGYEIRFWENRHSGKAPTPDKSVHVGFKSEVIINIGDYTTVELPASEYAVFEVYVARGYDSGNDEMEKWLADNKAIYGMRELDGFEYVIECYNEKFKDGDKPDSIVEFWLPLFRFCQSCAGPLTKPEDFGTEADGSKSSDYCCPCYENGSLYGGEDMKMEEMIEICVPYAVKTGKYKDTEAAQAAMMAFFPKLKRWAK